jgi:predicted XRE-type DNA-binding protein
MTQPLPPEKLKIGFWLNVEKLSDAGAGELGGCWLWRGAVAKTGYGQASFNGRTIAAHRASWQRERGAIPTGMLVLHKCDVRDCVRPSHLFLGTHKDNMADMYAKGRGPVGLRNGSRTRPDRRATGNRNGSRVHPEKRPRGEDHWMWKNRSEFQGERNPNASLTDAQVKEIRDRYASGGVTQVALAALFGITQAHVSRLVRGVMRG